MYVIYLESTGFRNEYGYWTGKSYIVEGASYPVTEDDKKGKVKIYKNKKVAERAAEKAYLKFGEVLSAIVEYY